MHEPRLTIYATNRLEYLLERLAATLRDAPVGPLEREVVIVESRGMYRWLTLELARELGIAAGLATPFPGTFCKALAERVEGSSRAAASERYEPSQRSAHDLDLSTWRLFGLLAERASEPTTPAQAFLGDDPDQRKRYQLAARLADRFEEYQLYRPDIVGAWERDVQPASATDAGDAAEWQAALWRALARADRSAGEHSPLARFTSLVQRLERFDVLPSELPRRVHLFAVNALAPVQLAVFAALARHVPVTFYCVEPTDRHWSDLVSERTAARETARVHRHGLSPTYAHADVGHVLLASLGRQGREFRELLLDVDELGSAWTPLRFEIPERTTLLKTLQADIAELLDRRALPESGRDGENGPGRREASSPAAADIAAGDRSLEVHVCHSPMREMEVLRDVLLDAFANDTELHPHDVFVLAPDITAYAPYVEAVFGKDRRAPDTIPFTIADRSPRYEEPVVEAAMRILSLAGGRMTAASVAALLDFEVVRDAAEIGADEAATLRGWLRDANIRWGVDGEHRRDALGLPCDDIDTWRVGLDRLVIGYAIARGNGIVNGLLPLRSGASDPELLGRGVAFFDRLITRVGGLHTPRRLDAWADDLRAVLDELLAPSGEQAELALRSLLDHVDELALGRTIAGLDEEVHIATVRTHLERCMEASAGGTGFLTGGVTFCTLRALRTIPARIVCVVGLNDGSVPRLERRASFDLMAVERRKGDRSPRDDDRYAFLQTILATRERLILSYVGRSLKDNSALAPSSLVAELLDVVDRCFRTDDGTSPRERVVLQHPLQPFSAHYFTKSAAADARLFSYSDENRRAAEAAVAPKDEPALFCPTALVPSEARIEVSIKELSDFLMNPSRHFCRDVLGMALLGEEEEPDETEPFRLDALARYGLTNRLVARYLRGDGERELTTLHAEGSLPHAGFGRAELAALDAGARDMVSSVTRFTGPPPCAFSSHPVDLVHVDWRITGLLESLTPRCLVRFRPAKIKPKDMLAIWVAHLVLCALREQDDPVSASLPTETFLVGSEQCLRLSPVADPRSELTGLITIYRDGARRPLPLYETASHAFAEQKWVLATPGTRATKDPRVRAIEAFEGREAYGSAPVAPGDLDDPYVALCARDRDPLTAEADEFEALAWRLWAPWFEHAHPESEA